MQKLRFLTVPVMLLAILLLCSTATHAKLIPSLGESKTNIFTHTHAHEANSYVPFDAIIILQSEDINKTKEVVNFIKAKGGVVSIVYIPNTLVVLKLPQNVENELISKYKVEVFRDATKLTKLSKISKIGATLLSAQLSGKYASLPTNLSFDTNDLFIAPDVPTKELKFSPFRPPGSSGYPPPASSSYTSYYMVGDVFASVILMESNGTIDPNEENWTQEEEDAVDSYVAQAFNMLVNHATNYNISYPLTFWTYPNHLKLETSYEPAHRPAGDASLWTNEIFNQLGIPGSGFITRGRNYANMLRTNYSTDWAFTIFVADSSAKPPSWSAWAYLGGPFEHVIYPTTLSYIIVHETLHIFWALDEYTGSGDCKSSADCTRTSGILKVENQNCQFNCAINQACIMRAATPSLCVYTAGQVGWRDLNQNGITDSIEYLYNPTDSDNDSDGILDYWDIDDDNDSVPDNEDACPKSVGYPAYNGCSPPTLNVDVNSSSVQVGETIRISANANDNFEIATLEIFVDNLKQTDLICSGIGTTDATCYKDLSYAVPGTHTFYATAKDDNNETRDPTTGEKNFEILPDSTNPLINVMGPTGQVDIGQQITIDATASDNFQLSWIAIYLDSNVVKNCTISDKNGNCVYTTSYSTPGTHSYYAITSDSFGNTAQTSIQSFDTTDLSNPALNVMGPTGQVDIGQQITIDATASDNFQLSWLAIYLDSNLVKNCTISGKNGNCSYSTTYSDLGTHSYYAIASDSFGNTAQTSIQSFDVADLSNPILIISANPQPVFVNEPITINVNANDNYNLAEISIVIDSTVVKSCPVSGKSATCSYEISYSSTGPAHYYYAKAKDSANNEGKSNEQSIVIWEHPCRNKKFCIF